MRASILISKKGLGSQAMLANVVLRQEDPERMMYDSVTVKPKLQLSLHEVRDSRNIRDQLRKVTRSVQSQLKKEVMWATIDNG